MLLCLTFIDLKKAFDTVETEAVIEALGNQDVPTQYIRMLGGLYDNFTTRIPPFYKEDIINVKRDDIVPITPNIEQAEQMPAEFDSEDDVYEKRYVYLGREVNMMNDLAPELCRRKRAAWGASKNRGSSEEDKEHPAPRSPFRHCCSSCFDVRLRDLDSTKAGWACRQRSSTRFGKDDASLYTDAVDYAKKSKIRWAGHVMRYSNDSWTRAVTDWIPRDIKRTSGRPPTRWSDFFTKALNERNVVPRVPEAKRFIGPLWLVTGTNGDVTGARSRKSTINRTTGTLSGDIESPCKQADRQTRALHMYIRLMHNYCGFFSKFYLKKR
uniref:Reverse transcriptase domain-containing protein n=1 Tax=Haemonchus contortus TaxID=6289 RepID=A0A7I4XXE3_HAECO